jgi:hypothetical protein
LWRFNPVWITCQISREITNNKKKIKFSKAEMFQKR